jgi:hypothetical protein
MKVIDKITAGSPLNRTQPPMAHLDLDDEHTEEIQSVSIVPTVNDNSVIVAVYR